MRPCPVMPNPSNIELVVMRRVRTIRVIRPFVSAGAFAFVILVGALWGIGMEVWVAHVLENAPSAGVIALGQFYLAAFEHTRLTVQVLALTTLVSLVYIARATVRLISINLISIRA